MALKIEWYGDTFEMLLLREDKIEDLKCLWNREFRWF